MISRRNVAALGFGIAALAVAFAGCGGGGAGNAVLPTPSPFYSPTPPPLGHMYASYAGASGTEVAEYALPVGPASVPDAILAEGPGNPSFTVNPNNGRFATITQGALAIFNPPFSASAKPFVTIPAGPATFSTVLSSAFDSWGNLWIETQFDIREFTVPFANYEVPAVIAAIPSTGAMEFGPDATMYLVPGGVNGATLSLAPVTPQPSLPPAAPTPPVYTRPAKALSLVPNPQSPFAFDQNGNAIASYLITVRGTPLPSPIPGPTAGIGVFAFPLNSLTLPSVILPAPGTDPVTSFTSSGSDATALNGGYGANFYVGDAIDGSFYAYPLPLTNDQAPSVRIACPSVIVKCRLPLQVFQFGP